MLSQKTIDVIKSTVPALEVYGTEITTIFYKNLFSSHPELQNIFNHANQNQGRQQTALANTVLAAATHIDKLESIIPVVKQIAQKHRSLGVKPEHYPIVGGHLLRAIKEVLGDAATDEILSAWKNAYGVIAGVFIELEETLYKQAADQEGGWKGFKQFKVVEKVEESDVITSFYLVPANNSPVPIFEPGQYITIRHKIPGETNLINRQYSLSAASNKESFRISVKREAEETKPAGVFSNYLHDHINQGDIVEITAPAGEFVLNSASTPVVFISGGVGVTPLMSMINSIAEQQPNRQVEFVHAAKNGKLQAFKQELDHLNERLNNSRFSFIYDNPSEQDTMNTHFKKQGYIDVEWLEENTILKGADYYICGPVPFLQAVVKGLKELGIQDSEIHYEFFGPAINMEGKC